MRKTIVVLLTLIISLASTANAGFGQSGKGYTVVSLGAGGQNTTQSTTGNVTSNQNKTGLGYAASLGIGHYFLDELRLDVSFVYQKGNKTKTKALNGATETRVKGTTSALGLLGAVSYDFLNTSDFTPYVTAGFGYFRSQYQVKLESGANKGSGSQSHFRYAQMFGGGITYHLSGNADLDLGYRNINMSNTGRKSRTPFTVTIANMNTTVSAKPQAANLFMIGLRGSF